MIESILRLIILCCAVDTITCENLLELSITPGVSAVSHGCPGTASSVQNEIPMVGTGCQSWCLLE